MICDPNDSGNLLNQTPGKTHLIPVNNVLKLKSHNKNVINFRTYNVYYNKIRLFNQSTPLFCFIHIVFHTPTNTHSIYIVLYS